MIMNIDSQNFEGGVVYEPPKPIQRHRTIKVNKSINFRMKL